MLGYNIRGVRISIYICVFFAIWLGAGGGDGLRSPCAVRYMCTSANTHTHKVYVQCFAAEGRGISIH